MAIHQHAPGSLLGWRLIGWSSDMRIVIISNINNGIGLQKDYELLRAQLEAWGHEVSGQQWDAPPSGPEQLAARYDPDTGISHDVPLQYDLAIWLEVVNEHLIPIARRHYLFANPEWLKPEYVRPIQRYVEKIFAKTHDAEKALRERFTGVHYTGFLTEDHRVEEIEKARTCLHIGGNSGFRNTQSVISAWREYRYWDVEGLPELVVVTTSKNVSCEETPGITFHQRVNDEELIRLQNSHLFHLYPSAYEGWGHALHEAQSCGAVTLLTDAPPMNEFGPSFTVPFIRTKRNNFGTLYEVSGKDIREAIPKMLAQPDHVIARMMCESRARFEKANREFGERFKPFVDETVEITTKPRLAILGNFEPEHSTENDLLWTLRDMGHQVFRFQENRDRTEEILTACQLQRIALLLYVHTHGWETPGKYSVSDLILLLREHGIKTASFHLDRYWGLNQNDRREDRVGEHPFWTTDAVFTADGGNQERFHERGINHHWLPPGVVKRDCYLGERREDLVVDVGFVGATGYHPEYPFRGELLGFLKEVYGERFRIFQGYRGKRLNDLYASIRVVVGDSCFGGSDSYWSDRVPETLGRGGFLIHPASKGLTIPGLMTFEPGNLQELQDKIDYYLDHPKARAACQGAAFDWVQDFETYHNRMTTLLRTMGVE
jgi:glycosyltransferase involved in cell wall biosynthesis